MSPAIGKAVNRIDGPEKVTGSARYSADILLPGLAHAAIVGAAIPSGRVSAIDTGAAVAAGGVVGILTHENLPKIAGEPHLLPSLVGGPAPGQSFFPMQDELVHYAGQPVALVIADGHERAQYAASLVEVSYERTPSVTTIEEGRDSAAEAEMLFGGLMPARSGRGDVEAALAEAEVRLDAEYRMAANHHNPIEAPATTAVWEGDSLTIYDSNGKLLGALQRKLGQASGSEDKAAFYWVDVPGSQNGDASTTDVNERLSKIIENTHLLQSLRVISHNPAMVRIKIAIRAPGNVTHATDQQ